MPERVLITGASGQLGKELQRSAPDGIELFPLDSRGLDITHPDQINALFAHHAPTLVINAAAYTAVDRAESEQPLAYAVNAQGAANLAQACAAHGARLLQLSTDFVFDGQQGTPYTPTSAPNPISVYGASKLAGEQQVLACRPLHSVIIRTAWVYSAHGSNFVKTMLRLMQERPQLQVVADQIGTPTWAQGLATALWQLIARPQVSGIHHWSDAGVASWYDFAVAIQQVGLELGLLQRAIPIHPITSQDFPTAAKRPAYSVLDKSSLWRALECEPQHWQTQLRRMLVELARQPQPASAN